MPSSAENQNAQAIALDKLKPWPQALWGCLCDIFLNRTHSETELAFEQTYARQARQHVQQGLWFSTAITALLMFGPGGIATLRDSMFAQHVTLLNILRFGMFLPTSALLFVVAYSSLYERYFPATIQCVVLSQIVGLAITQGVVAPAGFSIAVWVAVALFGMFSAYGLNQRQALRCALLSLVIYFAGGHLANVTSPQWYFEFCLLIFALASGAAIQAALATAVRAQYEARLSLVESAQRDGLTQLHNRRTFDERMKLMWNQAVRDRTSIALLMVDIDFFKRYNDSKGHLAGDECLTKVASILSQCARRPMDIVARYGGEEFAILLYDIDRTAVDRAAEDLIARITNLALPHPASPIANTLTVSMGGACIVPKQQRSYLGLIQLADEALYGAKQMGRNRAVVLDKEYDTLVTGIFRGQLSAQTITHNNQIKSDDPKAA